MNARSSSNFKAPSFIDWPLAIGVGLTVVYYAIVLQPIFSESLFARYTTEHLVEYAIVLFFLWGLTDVVFHVMGFPREMSALRQEWLPRSTRREPVARAAVYRESLAEQPVWFQRSRLGRRYAQALDELEAKGSAKDFDVYLRHLADMDFEQTQANYGLLRFQCWVMPMFGFLGTVIHFGTALSGHGASDIADNLAVVMSEMGTAFNTTTVALGAATTMMFAVFLCERIERGIVLSVDNRMERELAHRFEQADAQITPFLEAVQRTNEQCLDALNRVVETQAEVWSTVIERVEGRVSAHNEERERRFQQLLDNFGEAHARQSQRLEPAARDISSCTSELGRLIDELTRAMQGRGELMSLQVQLTENLRLLRETRQIDQALHGLTGAIHLLTARGGDRDQRAA